MTLIPLPNLSSTVLRVASTGDDSVFDVGAGNLFLNFSDLEFQIMFRFELCAGVLAGVVRVCVSVFGVLCFREYDASVILCL